MRIACFECLPLPPSLPPCPAPAQKAQLRGQDKDGCAAGPLVGRAYEATADEPRLTLEFPVGP